MARRPARPVRTTPRPPAAPPPRRRPAPPPRASERVLSRDPTYAADAYLPWFRDQVKAKLTPWGLALTDAAVSLATVKLDGTNVKAVVLAWDAAWGALPVTRDFPPTMSPVDARAAITAVHALPGWTKVTADQAPIDGVLGGELNALSAASRSQLRPTFAALKTRSADDQATALRGVLAVGPAMPSWSPEPMGTAVATATLVAPTAPTPGYHNHTVQEAAAAAGFLPKSARSVITRIMLNPVVNPKDAEWAVTYHRPDFHSYMTAGVDGVVTIYPDRTTNPLPNDDGRRSAMVHETGHTWSYKNWGTDTTKGKWAAWKTAMDADKTSVSGYANAAIVEDVAETIRVYVSTKGSPRAAEYNQIVPHRFTILKAEYDK
jgi:hypothetical protein